MIYLTEDQNWELRPGTWQLQSLLHISLLSYLDMSIPLQRRGKHLVRQLLPFDPPDCHTYFWTRQFCDLDLKTLIYQLSTNWWLRYKQPNVCVQVLILLRNMSSFPCVNSLTENISHASVWKDGIAFSCNLYSFKLSEKTYCYWYNNNQSLEVNNIRIIEQVNQVLVCTWQAIQVLMTYGTCLPCRFEVPNCKMNICNV